MAVDRLRFHLDEHVNTDVARALRRYGIDVTTTVEAGLRSADDTVQLVYAAEQQRVLVTHDADFLRHDALGMTHAGIAYCHQESRSVGELVRALILMYEVLTASEMMGRVEYL